jgi:hypothetical protein
LVPSRSRANWLIEHNDQPSPQSCSRTYLSGISGITSPLNLPRRTSLRAEPLPSSLCRATRPASIVERRGLLDRAIALQYVPGVSGLQTVEVIQKEIFLLCAIIAAKAKRCTSWQFQLTHKASAEKGMKMLLSCLHAAPFPERQKMHEHQRDQTPPQS